MSRHQEKQLHALYDVPGTGFRDDPKSPMYNQYHRLGWQVDYKAEEQYWNEEDLRVNPIVVMNIPDGIVGPDPVEAACEAYGAVKTINMLGGGASAFGM